MFSSEKFKEKHEKNKIKRKCGRKEKVTTLTHVKYKQIILEIIIIIIIIIKSKKNKVGYKIITFKFTYI